MEEPYLEDTLLELRVSRGVTGVHFSVRGKGRSGHGGSMVVSETLTLFQCSPGNEAERLLTVMKSRSLKVHRRRMHFRRSDRLSALAVRPGEKKEEKKNERPPHNGGWESGVLEFNSARDYTGPRIACLHAGLVNIPRESKKPEFRNCCGFISFALALRIRARMHIRYLATFV